VGQITLTNSLKAWNETWFFSANVLIMLVIFLVHVAIGGTLMMPWDLFAPQGWIQSNMFVQA
jgi:hypothetical protein